jgi:hypothetical protein
MEQVEKKILAINVVDIAIICVCPTRRPSIRENERVTAVLKTWLALHRGCLVDDKCVLASEATAEFVIRYVTATLTACGLRIPAALSRIFLPSWTIILLFALVILLDSFFVAVVIVLLFRLGIVRPRWFCIIRRWLCRLRTRFFRGLGFVLLILGIHPPCGCEQRAQCENSNNLSNSHRFSSVNYVQAFCLPVCAASGPSDLPLPPELRDERETHKLGC